MSDVKKLIRPNIIKMKPYSSARDIYSGGIMLDANESTMSAFNERDSPLRQYPDPAQRALRKKIARLHGVQMENIVAGNGSDEILDLIMRIFCDGTAHNVIISEPTYGMYQTICNIHNTEIRQVLLTEDFQPNADEILKQIDTNSRIVFLCSPNNPTGNSVYREIVIKLLRESGCIVVIDEAYADFSDEEGYISLVAEYPNLICVRTFSKAWGLAGLRCGYSVSSVEIAGVMMKIKMPYNLNYYTQKMIAEALELNTEKNQRVSGIVRARENIAKKLREIDGITTVYPSSANFLLFCCERHQELFDYLLKNDIIIRDRSSQPMLSECLRVTVGTDHENEIFLKIVEEFYN